MKLRALASVLMFGLTLFFVGPAVCVRSALAAQTLSTPPLRVLFIGNSYTYFNNLPAVLEQLANASQSGSLETRMVVEGGATLKDLWEHGTALKAIEEGVWTHVVLQEQSTLGPAPDVNGLPHISDPARFHRYAYLFDIEIKRAGAKTVFYLTWARQNTPQNQVKLTNAYESIAQKLGDVVVPVGRAWEAAARDRPDLALYQADRSHPTAAGTYLAACSFFAALFKRSPEGLPARVVDRPIDMDGHVFEAQSHDILSSPSRAELINLRQDEAHFLQAVAWAVQSDR